MTAAMAGSLWRQPEIIVFCLSMIVGLLGTIVGAIIWFVRLEGRVNYGEKAAATRFTALESGQVLAHRRIDETKEKHEEMEDRILTKMSAMEVMLAEINGYLRKRNEDR